MPSWVGKPSESEVCGVLGSGGGGGGWLAHGILWQLQAHSRCSVYREGQRVDMVGRGGLEAGRESTAPRLTGLLACLAGPALRP